MSLYAIGDLHLSLKVNKPMDVFGPGWADHVRRLEEGFSPLGEDDVPKAEKEDDPFDDIFRIFNKR